MAKRKTRIKIKCRTIEIVSLICLIVGIVGFSVGIANFGQLNSVYVCTLLSFAGSNLLISLILLTVHYMVYFMNKEKMSYREYNSTNKYSTITDVIALIVLNPVFAIIVIVLTILAIIS